MRLLVVEDEEKVAAFIARGLSEAGYQVDVARTGSRGLELSVARFYDLVVLDIMLPGLSGWSVLSELRTRGARMPILMLSALDDIGDRVRGLDAGADDYLVKPFSFSELLARVRTLLRRPPIQERSELQVADLEIDLRRQRATRAGQGLELTAKEFALLCLLVHRRGETVSRTAIAEQVWNVDFESDSNVIDVAIRRLRRKLDDPFEVKLIHTVRGAGYCLDHQR